MKSVLIISLTYVASEPRVLRQSQYLLSRGYRVKVAGFPGKDDIPKEWTFIDLSETNESVSSLIQEKVLSISSPSSSLKQIKYTRKWSHYFTYDFQKNFYQKIKRIFLSKTKKSLNSISHKTMYFLLFLGFSSAAEYFYWKNTRFKEIENIIKNHPSSLVLCHDYDSVPIAYHLGQFFNCEVAIDIHEHAVSQKKGETWRKNLSWYFFHRNIAHLVQKKYLPLMMNITVVSEGITREIANNYKTRRPPITVRSTPFYTQQSLNEPDSKNIKMIYHGILAPGRGLEHIIQTLRYLPSQYKVTFQGRGDNNYIKQIHDLAEQYHVIDRLEIRGPVAFHDIIPTANSFDFGLVIPKGISIQKRYALPNKFFEYIMAGIVVCASDHPEMAHIVKQYDLGILVSDEEPKKVADQIYQLDKEKIIYYKKRALVAAKELNWNVESQKLDFIDNYFSQMRQS